MRLPDGSILMHDAVHAYDPVKAHQYYLKTRELKGRKKAGATLLAPSTPKGQFVGTPGKPKGPAKGLPSVPAKKLDPKKVAAQRKAAVERVKKIKKQLAELNDRLKEKMAEAKAAEAKAKKGPTTAEKAEAARDAKKYRDKNEQKIANKAKKASAAEKTPDKPKEDTVESLRGEIAEVKGRLTAAVTKLRTLTAAK